MILYRNADARYPFLWEVSSQPEARWNTAGEGPIQYLADTPNGAWAEFLRHEEISEPIDLDGVERALWAVEVDLDAEVLHEPELDVSLMIGDLSTYSACQVEARRQAGIGATGLRAPSAALLSGGATGFQVDGGVIDGPPRDGEVVVLFGVRPDAQGWMVVENGRPPIALLARVRHLSHSRATA